MNERKIVDESPSNSNESPRGHNKYEKRHTKNYYRILYELKKIAPLFKVQKRLKNIKKRNSSINEKEEDEIQLDSDEEDDNDKFSKQQILQLFEKHPDKRTFEDLSILDQYLSTTKFVNKFLKANLFTESVEKMMVFCCSEMQIKRVKQNEIIFKIGEVPDYFYYIFSGTVDILKPTMFYDNMTGEEYFKYLMKLKRDDEQYIFTETINLNQSIYPIKKSDINQIHYIFFLMMLHLIFNGFVVNFVELINLCNISCEELELDPSQIGNVAYVVANKSKLYDKLPSISNEKLTEYFYLQSNEEKKRVRLLHNEIFLTLDEESHFGDMALDANTTRNATVKAKEDCVLLYIDAVLYGDNLAKGKKMIALKEINFIHQNYFFIDVNINTFERKYFNFFIIEDKKKGDIICSENTQCNFVYFIRSGDVCLYSHKSVLEIHLFLNKLNSMMNGNENKEYGIMKSNIQDIKEDLSLRKKNKIFLLSTGEIIGLEAFYFNTLYFTTAVVESDTAKIVKISTENLSTILNEERKAKKKAKITIENKMKIFYDRFVNINTTNITTLDERKFYNKEKNIVEMRRKNKEVETDLSKRNCNFDFSKGKKRYERHNSALLNSRVTYKLESKLVLPKIEMKKEVEVFEIEDKQKKLIERQSASNKKNNFDQFEEDFIKSHRKYRKNTMKSESIDYSVDKKNTFEKRLLDKLKEEIGIIKKQTAPSEGSNVKTTQPKSNVLNSCSSQRSVIDNDKSSIMNNVNFSLITQLMPEQKKKKKMNSSMDETRNKRKGPYVSLLTREKLKKYEIFNEKREECSKSMRNAFERDSVVREALPNCINKSAMRQRQVNIHLLKKKGKYQEFKSKMKSLLSWKFYNE